MNAHDELDEFALSAYSPVYAFYFRITIKSIILQVAHPTGECLKGAHVEARSQNWLGGPQYWLS